MFDPISIPPIVAPQASSYKLHPVKQVLPGGNALLEPDDSALLQPPDVNAKQAHVNNYSIPYKFCLFEVPDWVFALRCNMMAEGFRFMPLG